MDVELFTKTRQEALLRMHCRSDSRTSVVNTVFRPDREPLNTLDTWNSAWVKSVSFVLWTANKRACTTDSENTVATRMFSGSDCKQDLVAWQVTRNNRIWTKYSRQNAHCTCLVFKFASSKRHDNIITLFTNGNKTNRTEWPRWKHEFANIRTRRKLRTACNNNN